MNDGIFYIVRHEYGFSPQPLLLKLAGADWGEKDLYDHLISGGWKYFVQYAKSNKMFSDRVEMLRRREEAWEWISRQEIEYSWIGGRSYYEFAFKDIESATLFKLAYGI